MTVTGTDNASTPRLTSIVASTPPHIPRTCGGRWHDICALVDHSGARPRSGSRNG